MHSTRIQLILSLTTMFMIAQSDLLAQESKKYDRLKEKWNRKEGFIISKDSVKIEGLITWFSSSSAIRFRKVKFVSRKGRAKTYYPETIKGFGYDTLEFISDGKVFFEVIIKGPRINLYRNISIFESWLDPHEKYFIPNRDTTSEVLVGKWRTDPNSPFAYPPYYGPTINKANDLFIQKVGQSKIKYVDPVEFNSKFAEYFRDCPMLASKIKQKLWTVKDLLEIVSTYNEGCLP